MLGLVVTGVAYAEWTEMLWATFEIDTGYLHLEPRVWEYEHPYTGDYVTVWFDDHSDAEMDVVIIPGPPDDITEKWEKEWYIPYGYVDANVEANSFYIHLENVYPCLNASFTIELYNDGSIPAGYNGMQLLYLMENGNYIPDGEYFVRSAWDEGDDRQWWLVYDPDSEWYPEYPVCEAEVWLWAEDCNQYPDADPNSWEQIDPGCSVYATVNIHFNEALPEDTVYEFALLIYYVNWNEAGLVPCPT